MPTTDQQGSATAVAPGTLPHQSAEERTFAAPSDHTGVDHWQRRLDRARATMHLRQHDND